MQLDSDYIDVYVNGTSSPERRLWNAVILQALRDYAIAIDNNNKRGVETIVHHAKSKWFRFVCENAGLAYGPVIKMFERREKIYIGGKEWAKD